MRNVGSVWGIVAWFVAAGASAQMNPELGDVGPGGTPPMGGPPMGPAPMQPGGMQMQGQMQGGWGAPPQEAPAAPEFEAPKVPGSDDHAAVAGHVGVGFFGVLSIPVMSCSADFACMVNPTLAVPTPTVGVRYWLDEDVAIEGGLGFGISSATFETTDTGGTVTPIPVEAATAFALHAAVPIALANSSHFVFEVMPNVNFGIATGSLEDPNPMTGAMLDTWDLSGMLFEIGGRIGGEMHFGFIDIPELALQGTLGLAVRLQSRGAEQPSSGTKFDQSTLAIGTLVGNDPWDLLTGGITAIYYFTD